MAYARADTHASGTLGTSAADIYTAGAAESLLARSIRLHNGSGAAVDVTLWKRISGVDFVIWAGTIEAGYTVLGRDVIVGEAEKLRAVASAAAAVSYLVEGVIET